MKADAAPRDPFRIDADRILSKHISGFLKDADADPRKYPLALMNIAALTSSLTPSIRDSYAMAMIVLKNNAVRSAKTDLWGIARIGDLPAGTYYVCGVAERGRGTRVWNVRINLRPGRNSLLLDDKNVMVTKT